MSAPDMSLLVKRRFAPLFAVQFLGAFNDNLFKNALVVLLTFQAASWTTIAPATRLAPIAISVSCTGRNGSGLPYSLDRPRPL